MLHQPPHLLQPEAIQNRGAHLSVRHQFGTPTIYFAGMYTDELICHIFKNVELYCGVKKIMG